MESFDVGKGREHHAPAMPMNMHFYSVRRKNIKSGRYYPDFERARHTGNLEFYNSSFRPKKHANNKQQQAE